jgi:hypothetical protein
MLKGPPNSRGGGFLILASLNGSVLLEENDMFKLIAQFADFARILGRFYA